MVEVFEREGTLRKEREMKKKEIEKETCPACQGRRGYWVEIHPTEPGNYTTCRLCDGKGEIFFVISSAGEKIEIKK